MKKKFKYTNIIRVAFQSIILALIGYVALRPVFDKTYVSDFEAYCPFGGLSSLGSKLYKGTMSCNMSETQVVLGIVLIAGVIIFGKLFCSYICPIGSITEWLGKIGDKFKLRREMPKVVDRPLRALKYIILFATLYITMTSSELFCKEFDPYFASVNLFDNTDMVLYFAIPAFVITILGTIFFRLFWCKYLCPLGALSNIFLNVIPAAAIIILYVIVNALGAGISLMWLVLAILLVGAVTELGFLKSIFAPIPKITRDEETCTDCGLCDEKCPQGIKISSYTKVNHTDCNLCSDCVYACPLKNTITINNSKKWKYLAPISVIVLVIVGLGASKGVEFTTISDKWGNYSSVDNIAVYEQAGLKNVKCYGSSKALESQLINVDGIYGLDTYAASHTVKIYYNPSEISETKVRRSLFTPIKQEIRKLKAVSIDSLAIFEVGVFGLFDLIDNNNLFYLLKEDAGIYGFETHFGEPVKTDIFFDINKTDAKKIISLIEKKFTMVKKGEGEEKVEIDFKVENEGISKGSIGLNDYTKRIFRTYDKKFNDYKRYNADQLNVFAFPMPEAGMPPLRRYFGSLASHLSADNGIVRLSTKYEDKPYGYIFFDPSQTSVDKIKSALVKQNLTIFVTETEKKDIPNPFHIKPEGKVLRATELNFEEDSFQ
ncbi:MAG: 4Fe-4S binding protein [Melioribacter sp.]|nr:4Fe-4S binding protein [Melioribacter sp.]